MILEVIIIVLTAIVLITARGFRKSKEGITLEQENQILRECLQHYVDNGYSKAITCFKKLEK
jgi:hypothetical protein